MGTSGHVREILLVWEDMSVSGLRGLVSPGVLITAKEKSEATGTNASTTPDKMEASNVGPDCIIPWSSLKGLAFYSE